MFGAPTGIAGYDGALAHRFNGEAVFLPVDEAKEIARQKEVDNLAPAVGRHRAFPRHADDYAVPMVGGIVGAVHGLGSAI